ncbi:AraC family transcriptional regulator [Siminovitchia fortis]|uniref:AraC family transcriptional regulator n=1 Tax=Siminovitchia fortis TaxID=254758 RepID=A0A443ILX3_9BACI|nr:AraC family transcriptional regulator [Siminovitchia fortis]RWR06536.1 AraC family transcriptional regulator [Siminovitchia fortis]WHY80836.1 AraC family transcriptional regulator [Siminovitchia fortis]
MALVESLQKAIDYMETHLLDTITAADIAKQANVSSFHFQRIFMILTDMSVGEYLRRRRLTLAAQELSSTDSKIIDLAFKYGYDTPESFSRAFRKQHGITPSEARKGIGKLQSYNRLVIQVNLKGAEPMNYRIVKRNAFEAIGIKRKFQCGEEMGIPGVPEFWEETNRNGESAKLLQLNNGQIKGLLGICSNFNIGKNTTDYSIAAEHNGEIPDGFSTFHFPAAKWAVFEARGPVPDAIIDTTKKIYSEWFPSNGCEPAEIASFEAYIDSDPYKKDSYNEIWIAIK